MRDFSWKYFTMTGDVDAYLLYKQIVRRQADEWDWFDREEAEADEDQYDPMN